MKSIETKTSACNGCTRCLRRCEVKAITLSDGFAFINDDLCILCGECIAACRRKARFYLSDLSKISAWLSAGQKIAVILDPSYIGAFPTIKGGQLITALRKAGFSFVHESSEAAAAITSQLTELAKGDRINNIITSNCPSINKMIETYYPDLLDCLAPIASPAIAEGRYLKQKYGKDTLVVSVSPCIARKDEAYAPENKGCIDGVLTFYELFNLLNRHEVIPEECDESLPDNENTGINQLYPTAGGIITALRMQEDFPDDRYMSFHISGIVNCKNVLNELRNGIYTNCVIEMNACPGGCVNGPLRPEGSSGYKNNLRIKSHTERVSVSPERIVNFLSIASVGQEYTDKTPSLPMPSEEEIKSMLIKMGRKSRSSELDCGACGYRTCRENAIAICQGRSTHDRCIQYLHDKASSLANLVMDTTPNMVMILDSELTIQEFSASCSKYFHISHTNAIGKQLIEIIDDTDYAWALEKKTHLRNKIVELPEYDLIVQQNITYLEKEHGLLVILIDITREHRREEEEYMKKLEIAELAQKIIDKQMMSAQMIAGLLGETTAETKVTLNKLCRSLLGEEGGDV